AQDFPKQKLINRGFGGSTIPDCTRYVDRIVTPYQPRQIIFYAGDNDIAAGHSPKQIADDYQAFVAKVRQKLPDVPIDFISIKPSIARWKFIDQTREANRLIEQFCKPEKNL